MSDSVKCRYPACEDDTDCMNGCKPAQTSIAFPTPDEIELRALRGEVSMLLDHCTEKQLGFFLKVYPGGVQNMDRDKLRNAVGLCQRTVRKNLTGDAGIALTQAQRQVDK